MVRLSMFRLCAACLFRWLDVQRIMVTVTGFG